MTGTDAESGGGGGGRRTPKQQQQQQPPLDDLRANRRDKQQRKRQRKRAADDFSLMSISDDFARFVIDTEEDALTLPPFTKHQCVQIKSLAAIYELKMRVIRGGGVGGSGEGIEGGDDGGACVLITKCTKGPGTTKTGGHLPEGAQEMALARLLATEVRGHTGGGGRGGTLSLP